MFNIGMPELILILVVALLIFGPTKLPELARSLGKGLAEFRRASSDLRAQLLDPPVETRPPTPAPPAATPQAAPATPPAEAGLAAQAEAGSAAQAEAGSAAPEGTTPVKEAAAGTSAQKQGQPSVG